MFFSVNPRLRTNPPIGARSPRNAPYNKSVESIKFSFTQGFGPGGGLAGQDSGQLSPSGGAMPSGGAASPRGQQLRDHLAKITHQKMMKQRQNQGAVIGVTIVPNALYEPPVEVAIVNHAADFTACE